MLISIDHHNGIPVFRQVIDQVKFYIVSGLLAPGDELPSTRALSGQLGLNPMTVSKAYSLLEAEGLVERRRGRPLTIKPLQDQIVHAEKLEQLKPQLTQLATMVRQLGVDRAEVVDLFISILDALEKENDNT
ncbi:MAG: GntR family transcriptional regulator [Gemmatimonadetes bacterium]|nr:GntR family transcriptional regulator [Gemmatimonadota bacterium]